MYNAKAIRKVLEDYGFRIYSIRKQKRMEGGQRYDFHGGLRQGFHKGTPHWFYQVELLSDGHADYDLAVDVLEAAGYKGAKHGAYCGLRFNLPYAEQLEHRARLTY